MKHSSIVLTGIGIAAIVGVSALVLTQYQTSSTAESEATQPASKEQLSPEAIITEARKPATPADLVLPRVTVYKSASCGCCAEWIEHMKDSGFPVEFHNAENLQEYKVRAKLGPGMGSCHTAFVGDYAIEGHVPATDVKRLLAEKPDISGLTAPGMPMNSPGMAPKGSAPSGYDVIAYKDGEKVGAFSQY